MLAQRSNLAKLALFARPTCSSYASAFGDEGKGVNDGQRICNLMSDQVYYVLDIIGILAVLRRYARAMCELVCC